MNRNIKVPLETVVVLDDSLEILLLSSGSIVMELMDLAPVIAKHLNYRGYDPACLVYFIEFTGSASDLQAVSTANNDAFGGVSKGDFHFVISIDPKVVHESGREICNPASVSMWTPVRGLSKELLTSLWGAYSNFDVEQFILRSYIVIPSTGNVMLLGVESPSKPGRPFRLIRKEQLRCVVKLIDKSEALVRGHAVIMRPAEP